MELAGIAQTAVSGLANGALYALVSLSFSLVSRSTGVINFAQGDLTMLGGILTAVLCEMGVPLIVAVPAASAACALVNGAFYFFVIRPSTRASVGQIVIITVGLSILIRGVVTCLWGTDPKQVPPFSSGQPIAIARVSILPQQLWLIGLLIAVALLAAWFFRRLVLGLALRASAINPLGASYVGIDNRALAFFVFTVSGFLSGLVGAVWAPIAFAQVDVGFGIGLKGFTGAILGGMNTTGGPIIGGVLLALFEAFAAGYVSSHYQDALIFGLLILALLLRPQGLLGRVSRGAAYEKPEDAVFLSGYASRFTRRDLVGLAIGIAALAVIGVALPNVWIANAIFAGIETLVVIGLVLLTGFAGQLSLGQTAFMMIGAYASAYLTVRSGWPPIFAMLAGVALSVVVALSLGRIIFRLRGFYLSMGSLGLAMIALTFAREWTGITGGASGFLGINSFSIFGLDLGSDIAVYNTVAGFAFLMLLCAMSIARSRIGRALLAIRTNELAARACGVNVVSLKIRIFAFSAATASIAGSLYGHYLSIVNPAPFDVDTTIQQLTALALGGFVSLWGAFAGSLITVSLPQLIGLISGSAANQLIAGLEYVTFGVLLIGIVMMQSNVIWYRLQTSFGQRFLGRKGAVEVRTS